MRETDCKKNVPHSAFHIPHSGGFTLLEVMIAVAILAMVLVSLLGLKNRSTQNVMLSEHITTATLLAKRMMTETLVTAGTGTVVQKEDEGEFEEEEFKDYTWKKTISPMQVEGSSGVKITEVRVAVLWKEGERPEQVELASYE
jgi:general secretion pathway protein I